MIEAIRESVIVRVEMREGKPGLAFIGSGVVEFVSFTPDEAKQIGARLYELAKNIPTTGQGASTGDGQPR